MVYSATGGGGSETNAVTDTDWTHTYTCTYLHICILD